MARTRVARREAGADPDRGRPSPARRDHAAARAIITPSFNRLERPGDRRRMSSAPARRWPTMPPRSRARCATMATGTTATIIWANPTRAFEARKLLAAGDEQPRRRRHGLCRARRRHRASRAGSTARRGGRAAARRALFAAIAPIPTAQRAGRRTVRGSFYARVGDRGRRGRRRARAAERRQRARRAAIVLMARRDDVGAACPICSSSTPGSTSRDRPPRRR